MAFLRGLVLGRSVQRVLACRVACLAVLKVGGEPLQVSNNDANVPACASVFLLNNPNDIFKRRSNAFKVDFDIRKLQQNQYLLDNNARVRITALLKTGQTRVDGDQCIFLVFAQLSFFRYDRLSAAFEGGRAMSFEGQKKMAAQTSC